MHRSSGFKADAACAEHSVTWEEATPLEDWLKGQPSDSWRETWERDGVLVVKDLLNKHELEKYKDLYQQMLDGKIDTTSHRHDLGNHEKRRQDSENICQIMWPSLFVSGLAEGPLHERARHVARIIMGDDIDFDFDMLLSKAPHTETPTPWHQDESYWLDLPDKRAASCWCPMDDVDVDNGCMWFSPGAHLKPLRPHHPAAPGVHVLLCDATEDIGRPYPLSAGSVTFHHGRMLHYSRGNSTSRLRRAYVTNFRPRDMIRYEREHDYDHGKEKGVGAVKGIGQAHESSRAEPVGDRPAIFNSKDA